MGRIDQYIQEARARARRRKSQWNLILIPLVIGFIGFSGAAYYLLWKAIYWLHRSHIPPGVILSSYTRLSGILIFVPILWPAMTVGMVAVNVTAWCIPPPVGRLIEKPKASKGRHFEKLKDLRLVSLLSFAVTLPVSLWGSTNYLYVREDGISYHPLLSLQEKRYAWSDIEEIRAGCKRYRDKGGSYLELTYAVKMRDGTLVDLWQEARMAFLTSYERFAPFLANQSQIRYSYDVTQEGWQMVGRMYSPPVAGAIKHILYRN